MRRFERYEEFVAQDERFNKVRARYDGKVIEAGRRVEDCRAELDAVIRSELSTGEDKSADKVRIRKRIAEAEAEYEAAQEERGKAYEFARDESDRSRITFREVLLEFNGPYRQSVRETELKPIQDRIQRARAEYLNALCDLYEMKSEYYVGIESELRDIARLDNESHPGNHMMPLSIVTESDVKPITRAEIVDVMEQRKVPDDVKRVRTQEVK